MRRGLDIVVPVAEGADPAGLVCLGPHPRCGTRRFTTRVAQVRAAAAPCRRFKPPNAGDYATSPWHWAVARQKNTKRLPGRSGTRRSQASHVLGRSRGRRPGPNEAQLFQNGINIGEMTPLRGCTGRGDNRCQWDNCSVNAGSLNMLRKPGGIISASTRDN